MSDREILSNAIDKAIATGYEYNNLDIAIDPLEETDDYLLYLKSYQIIFSHSFAKAFFGEEPINIGSYEEVEWIPAWKFHLQQMVLEENPIQYLAKFL